MLTPSLGEHSCHNNKHPLNLSVLPYNVRRVWKYQRGNQNL